MGRAKKGHRQKSQPVYGSDDERAYAKEKVPDPTSNEYYHDEIDDFHADKEKILLSKGASLEPAGFSSDEQEEVLGFDSDDDDDEDLDAYDRKIKHLQSREMEDEMASDIDEKDDDLPDDKAWGKKKNKYYGADVSDEDDVDFSGSETDAAVLEEQEALALQKKMTEELDEQDFGLDIFKTIKKPEAEKDEDGVIVQDLSKLSKKEKLQLLKKDSPELLDLIEEYKSKMTEIRDKLSPMLRLVLGGQIPAGRAVDYVETKFKLNLNYCINISFYLMLKAKRTPVHNHPVISRLVQHRNLIKQLEVLDEKLEPEMDLILEKVKNGEEIALSSSDSREKDSVPIKSVNGRQRRPLKSPVTKPDAKKKKLSELMDESGSEEEEELVAPSGGRSHGRKKAKLDGKFETKDEKEALAYYDMMKAGRGKTQNENENEDGEEAMKMDAEDGGEGYGDAGHDEEDEEMGKRGITYQIAKNKGLTPHRQKIQRNPRVKHRMKFRKAKIRRKGQIREGRTEMERYSGEISGIRAGVIKGVKLK